MKGEVNGPLAVSHGVISVSQTLMAGEEWETGEPHGQIQLPPSFNGIVPIAGASDGLSVMVRSFARPLEPSRRHMPHQSSWATTVPR